MLLPTMTYEEMYREVLLDSDNMIKWSVHNAKNLRRLSLKAAKFPFEKTLTHTTPRKNQWTMIFVVLRKVRTNQDIYNILYTSLRADEGDIYMLLTPSKKSTMTASVFPPHFMKRFRERMGLDLKGKELARRYFILNDSGYFVKKPDGDHEECLCTREGICLGEFINDRMYVARTFIRYDMSLGWQREAFEKFRRMFNGNISVLAVGSEYTENSSIKEVYRERDRSQPIVFHH